MTPGNRLTLGGLLAVGLAPLLLAAWMYGSGSAIPSGRTNQGQLIVPPWSLRAAGVTLPDAAPRWRLLLLGGAECEATCVQWLYTLRQVNTALGRDAHRVNRYYLPPQSEAADSAWRQQLQQMYPQLRIWPVDYARLQRYLQPRGVPDLQARPLILVADPHGNVMLRYDVEQSGKQILQDLKRLLKVSKIG